MFDINNEKIDLVYTWVDGNDPLWKEKKNYWASHENAEVESIEDGRFVESNELKYSLRSVEMFAPWINKIYIVTDNQVPKWLNINNKKIKIIDHRDIIPKENLPVFNSIAIDHCIVNIKNLSEYFLYACDDMFFAKKTTPSFFYTPDGKPIFRFRKHYNPKGPSQYVSILKYTDELIKNRLGFKLERYAHHNIDAYKKSDIIKCQEFFKDEINQSIASKFRKNDNVERQIYALYCIKFGLGKYKEVRRIDTNHTIYEKIFLKLLNRYDADSCYIPLFEKEYEKIIKRYNPYLLCFNDGSITNNDDRLRATQYLDKLFSTKSSFEL